MVYTHYIENQQDISEQEWTQISRFFCELYKRSVGHGVELVGGFAEKYTLPALTEDYISFNGVGDLGHESCVIEREPMLERGRFSFCKTAEKPYDIYVVALYAFLESRGIVSFSSDGDASELLAGRNLFKDIVSGWGEKV